MRILVVEDETKVAGAFREGLESEDYEVEIARTGEEVFFLVKAQTFDLVILDLMLPGCDGLEIFRTLRQRGLETPVLILTTRDAVDDRVTGLDSGADDYLVKPFAAGFAGIGGYILAGRVLAPLNRIIDHAKMISAENISDRLPVDDHDDELGQLAGILNDTFSRLERSFNELRRFTSDVSHELRTPLTAIRSVGEVALRKASDEQTYRDTISSMLEEVDRLSLMVDDLLRLSRADSGAIQLEKDHVKLEDLAQELIDYLSVLAEEKNQSIVMDVEESADALVDHRLLRHAIIDLLDNAIKYSRPGSTVRIAVKTTCGCPVMEVIDTGPGIPGEHCSMFLNAFSGWTRRVQRKRMEQVLDWPSRSGQLRPMAGVLNWKPRRAQEVFSESFCLQLNLHLKA